MFKLKRTPATGTPEGLTKAQETLQALVAQSRAQLAESQRSATTRHAMDRAVIAQLYQAVVGTPNITHAALLLARVSPAAIMGLDADAQPGFAAPDASDAVRERKITLYAAILEAGLSEQVLANGSVLGGGPLSAVALEATFDDWMIRGRHRPGFDAGELAKIDNVISRTAQGPLSSLDILQTRFGVLLPVLANVHLWRILEAMPPEISARLGWDNVDSGVLTSNTSSPTSAPATELESERG